MTRTTLHKRLKLSALENRVTPAIYVVDALTDTGGGTGLTGDLRFCITQANANAGPDVINATGITGAIFLGAELPTITDDVAINGPGAKLLDIDGQLGVRLLQISTTEGKQVDFSNLKLTNGGTTGNGGAVLVNNATATFSNCVLNNSFANVGGLVSGTASSTISINNCSLSGSFATAGGGAVYSTGTLSIRNSTLSGNITGSVGSGGAVVVGGASAATIINSTLSGNTAGAHGGAIRTSAAFTGQLLVRNTTITLNSVVSSTGSGRGVSVGGAGGSVIIDSTIVAQNTSGAGSTSDVSGTIKAGYSLFGTTDAATITGNGNFKGTNMSPVNAKLGTLADNGGPTLTHMPADDSPVREAGVDQDAQPEDQRGYGYARLENYATDIGAVETLNFKPMAANIDVVVNQASPNTTLQFTVTYFDPRGSSLVDYSSLGTGDLYVPGPNGYFEFPTFISAAPGVDAQTIVARYEIPAPVNSNAGWDISDNGIYSLIASPNEVFDKDTPNPNAGDTVAFAFLRVEIPVVYTVDEATDVVDGKTGVGEMSLREAVDISNADNQPGKIVFDSAVFGSATTITLTGGQMPITDTLNIEGPGSGLLTLDANQLSRHFSVDGPGTLNVSISGLTLTHGKVADLGGAVFCNGENLTIQDCIVSKNTSADRAGGIRTEAGGLLTILDSQIDSNTASRGGGLIAFGGAVIQRSTIADNFAYDIVGGMGVERSLFIDSSTISGNRSDYNNCGGLQLQGPFAAPAVIQNSTISGNTASTWGGGIVMIRTFAGVPFSGLLSIANSTITNNYAGYYGGGIWQDPAERGFISATSAVISGNGGSYPDIYTLGVATLRDSLLSTASGITTPMLSGTTASLLGLTAKLGPLANNGGPTKTHALLPGSPAINAGSNALSLTFDQRGMGLIRSNGQTDIGAFEQQSTKVTSVQINDGSAQRSRITSVAITFDSKVSFQGGDINAAAAFTLDRVSPTAGSVDLAASVDSTGPGTVVTLTFIGGTVDNISLADGRYALHALAAQFVFGLDGDGNGIGGDDFMFDEPAAPATLDTSRVFRFFGDANGDGSLGVNDFNLFRSEFGGTSLVFDFNNDGSVGGNDFNEFRNRFGGSI